MDDKKDLHHKQGEHEECASEEDAYEEADEYLENFYINDDVLEEEKQESDFLEENTCTVMSEQDIRQRQEEEMERVCSILCISKDQAFILVLHFRWDLQRVINEWLVKEEDIRRDLGLLETRVSEVGPNSVMVCNVCSYIYCISGMSAGTCGHYFCNGCWLRWIQQRIYEARAECLKLKCFEPSCKCFMGQEMVLSLLVPSEERYLEMYRQHLVRFYVETNRDIKWCPAPGCKYAVEVDRYKSGFGSYEVTCKCCHEFCWNCSEEPHSPVDCETAKKWMLRSSDDVKRVMFKISDNGKTEKWKLVNTKPCPKCKSPIFKDGGCKHMTCVSCCFQFCWLCLGNWSNHNAHCDSGESSRHAHYDIDEYHESKDNEAVRKRNGEYYYERWAANEYCRADALSDLLQIIHSDQQPQFVTDAWLKIVKCRRVFKWTYTYGYYLAHSENADNMNCFEDLQACVESSLNRLHQLINRRYFPQCTMQDNFTFCHHESSHFHRELSDLINVTDICFKNLIKFCEKGLTTEEF